LSNGSVLLSLAKDVEAKAKALNEVLGRVAVATGLPVMEQHIAEVEARFVAWVPKRLRAIVDPPPALSEDGARRRALGIKAAAARSDEAEVVRLTDELGLLGATVELKAGHVLVTADHLSVEV
jgi:hypothetical protein